MVFFQRVKRKLKSYRNDISFFLGKSYKKVHPKRRNRILMYHGVCDRQNPFNQRHCYIKDFENQIRYLSKSANIVSLEDFFLGKFDPDRANVAITFDDGYLNNLTLAAPVLLKYHAKASVYVTGLHQTCHPYIWADFLQIVARTPPKKFVLAGESYCSGNGKIVRESDKRSLLDIIKTEKPDWAFKEIFFETMLRDFQTIADSNKIFWQLMSEDQIREISSIPGITIGSHGYYHNNLGRLSTANALEEVKQSKRYLENLIQAPVNELAFPDGSYTIELVNAAKREGFRFQLATEKLNQPEDSYEVAIKSRSGIYQSGSWANQLIFPE